jgi:hypothetical protein
VASDLLEHVKRAASASRILCVAVLLFLPFKIRVEGQSIYSIHAGSHLNMGSTNSADWIFIPPIRDWSFSVGGYRFGLEQYNPEWSAIHVGHWKKILHRTVPECVVIVGASIAVIVLGWFIFQRLAGMGTNSANTRTESS